MTNERETAEVIRTWMKEEVQLDDAGVHRVLAPVPWFTRTTDGRHPAHE